MTTPRTASRRGPLVAIIAIAVVLAAAAGLWYLFLRPAGPAPVSLATLPPASAATSPSGGQSPAATAEATAGTSPASSAAPDGDDISGAWAVDAGVGSFSDFSGSFVGYRVREELATIGATEAVGRTPDVTGTLAIDGTTVTAGEITADLTTLQSDEPNRDRQLSRQALETGQFPSASFVLSGPVDLGSVPAEGETVDVMLPGDLTLHGVTRAVEVPAQARLQGGVITVVGSLPIAFADYDIDKPRSMIVLTVEDNGTLEFQVHFSRS
jgi:polyisoprenoid-binding protein YceI